MTNLFAEAALTEMELVVAELTEVWVVSLAVIV
jgi:hypothetical protein